MVLVEVDANYIDAEPMKNRTEQEMIRAYQALLERIKSTGVCDPKKHIMDNEASAEFKKVIKKQSKLQMVPPDSHRRNIAERAIQTFKNHFVAILSGVDAKFPMQLWCKLLPQTILTLNLMRQSNVAPKVSAYAYLHGEFSYNDMPLAPLGCAVQLYETPHRRKTWAEHSVDGFYVGSSDEHYRSHKIWVTKTKAMRVSETVFFKHKYITQPTLTPKDVIIKALQDLKHALNGTRNHKGDKSLDTLVKMDELLNVKAKEKVKDKVVKFADDNPRIMEYSQDPRVPLGRMKKKVRTPKRNLTVPPSGPAAPSAVRTTRRRQSSGGVTATEVAAAPRVAMESVQATPRVAPSQARFTTAIVDPPSRNTRSKTKPASNPAMNTRAQSRISNEQLMSAIETLSTNESRRGRSPIQALRELANAVLDVKTGKMLEYRHLRQHPELKEAWDKSGANEFGRLAQGIGGRIKGTNTIAFIREKDIPKERRKDCTYGKFVCDVRPTKAEPNRTRLTVGGDRINYPEDCGTPTADMLLVKLLLNSVISTRRAKFMTADIKNFYLNTPLTRYEYVRLKLSDIPEEVIREYKLREKANADGTVYIEIRKGMYGLPQAGLLAQQLLEKRLETHGYTQSKIIPGFWKHKWRPIQFSLVVDDFGVKYEGEEHAQHLMNALKNDYEISEDWEGEKYIGLTIDWDYEKGEVHVSMPGYVSKALQQFNHKTPSKKQDSPYPWIPPKYGEKVQYAKGEDETPILDDKKKRFIQQVTGKFLFYGRAVDSTMLTALSAIASQQSKPTEETMKIVKQFLDYCASQEDAVVTYRRSDMKLAGHSDAGYLNEPKSRSRAGGHFYMSNDAEHPPNNGAVLNIAQIIKAVMSSAAESELGALYINAREAVYIRQILEAMGHEQHRTPLQTDNSTAEGVINNRIQPKRTKAMDMRFHWLRDRESQKQFRYFWRPGTMNLADYWTKQHPGSHHKNVRPEFLTPVTKILELRRKKRVGNKNLEEFRTQRSLSARVC